MVALTHTVHSVLLWVFSSPVTILSLRDLRAVHGPEVPFHISIIFEKKSTSRIVRMKPRLNSQASVNYSCTKNRHHALKGSILVSFHENLSLGGARSHMNPCLTPDGEPCLALTPQLRLYCTFLETLTHAYRTLPKSGTVQYRTVQKSSTEQNRTVSRVEYSTVNSSTVR